MYPLPVAYLVSEQSLLSCPHPDKTMSILIDGLYAAGRYVLTLQQSESFPVPVVEVESVIVAYPYVVSIAEDAIDKIAAPVAVKMKLSDSSGGLVHPVHSAECSQPQIPIAVVCHADDVGGGKKQWMLNVILISF